MSARVRSEAAPGYFNGRGLPPEHRALIAQALAVLEEFHRPGQALASPAATMDFLRLRLAAEPDEKFVVLFLDNRHRVISLETLFTGTIDGASVHPRVVVRRALELNSAAVILAHNHPSGAAEPSHADVAITQRLREALALVDVRVLDHLIVGAEGGLSFAERGLL